MGALAFQEHVMDLAAAAQSQPVAMPKKAEILTLKRAGMVRSVNKMIDNTWVFRSKLISSLHQVPDLENNLLDIELSTITYEAKRSLEDIIVRLEVPVMVDPEGGDAVEFLYGLAKEWSKKSADDGRFLRRLAKRAREARDACDSQRLRVRERAKNLLSLINDVIERKNSAPAHIKKNMYDKLFDEHLEKYPVTMNYLAR